MGLSFRNGVSLPQEPGRPFWRAHHVTKAFLLLDLIAVPQECAQAVLTYLGTCICTEPGGTLSVKAQ